MAAPLQRREGEYYNLETRQQMIEEIQRCIPSIQNDDELDYLYRTIVVPRSNSAGCVPAIFLMAGIVGLLLAGYLFLFVH
jgi:hypothetical protein